MKKDQDELLQSNYDGIQEYNNDLPRWWVILFYITIAFAVVYTSAYFLGFTRSSQQRLADDLKIINAEKKSLPSENITTDVLLAFAKDPAHITAGQAIFKQRCTPCHGDAGQGIVGPNLTDAYWLHGGAITDIRHTIENGYPEKGMLSWKGILSEQDISDVAAYVRSIKGSNPPNPKAPQGDIYSGDQ